jgi:hypothetical protein
MLVVAVLKLKLNGSVHIAGGNGACANAGAIVIVDIIRANRVASILRDMFIFILPSPFSKVLLILFGFKPYGIILYLPHSITRLEIGAD